jgi:hypothetical protein
MLEITYHMLGNALPETSGCSFLPFSSWPLTGIVILAFA